MDMLPIIRNLDRGLRGLVKSTNTPLSIHSKIFTCLLIGVDIFKTLKTLVMLETLTSVFVYSN
jgi:hypothetical protein